MAKNSSRSVQLLEQLSTAFGVSGFEDDVRNVIAQLVRPLVDEMRVDPLGNLIVTRKGKSDFTLMLDAHMDEVGLIISYIEEKGFLRWGQLGYKNSPGSGRQDPYAPGEAHHRGDRERPASCAQARRSRQALQARRSLH
jgi:hypothetical protein